MSVGDCFLKAFPVLFSSGLTPTNSLSFPVLETIKAGSVLRLFMTEAPLRLAWSK